MYSLNDKLSFLGMIPVVGKVYDNSNLWFNFGLIDKAPIFDQVIQDWDAKMSSDPINEKFVAFEFGLNTSSNDGTMAGKINYYNTSWNDRVATKYITNLDGDDDILYLTGINQVHSGIEVEFAAQVHSMVRLDAGVGLGAWTYKDDPSGTYRDGDSDVNYAYALTDLNVGDMPQRNLSLATTVTPVEGATIQLVYRYYDKYFADWSVESREYSPDSPHSYGDQTWQAPSYGVLDLHAYYDIPFEFGPAKPQVFFHMFNALDAVYVQDATHNSKYNAWDKTGRASDAEVFLGLPMSFNAGLTINF
jgi:hypothetical protein